MGKLYAISDLHLSFKLNLDAFVDFFSSLPSCRVDRSLDVSQALHVASDSTEAIGPDDSERYLYDFTEDGLVLVGDVSEKLGHLRTCFQLATQKFKTVWWVPGNHELYTLPRTSAPKDNKANQSQEESDVELNHKLRGVEKYLECCRVASEYGIFTPEDEFIKWDYEVGATQGTKVENTTQTQSVLVCPVFTLYDYSFRPPHISREEALDWAMEENICATDEMLLHPDPYTTRDEWCAHLITQTEEKLHAAQSRGFPLVIANHWPLREDLISISSVPRFTLWCGTKKTKDWHTRYNARAVVTGHLHVRRTDWRDGVRFEEVSLGYPKQWEGVRAMGRGVGDLIREILPGKYGEKDVCEVGETIWRRNG